MGFCALSEASEAADVEEQHREFDLVTREVCPFAKDPLRELRIDERAEGFAQALAFLESGSHGVEGARQLPCFVRRHHRNAGAQVATADAPGSFTQSHYRPDHRLRQTRGEPDGDGGGDADRSKDAQTHAAEVVEVGVGHPGDDNPGDYVDAGERRRQPPAQRHLGYGDLGSIRQSRGDLLEHRP